MATLGTINPDTVHGQQFAGLQALRIPFTDIDDTDTYESGVSGIRYVGFEADGTGDEVAVTFSGSTITFNTGDADEVGWLWIWYGGESS